jgi:hypothetical protein
MALQCGNRAARETVLQMLRHASVTLPATSTGVNQGRFLDGLVLVFSLSSGDL